MQDIIFSNIQKKQNILSVKTKEREREREKKDYSILFQQEIATEVLFDKEFCLHYKYECNFRNKDSYIAPTVIFETVTMFHILFKFL